ncbi:MAG: hypothetical protein JWN67_419 [Actinomycetia bacterium]|nr:hypothetical protein [Actinomycetes bacterium]
MIRENAVAKARRYLAEGRLIVTALDQRHVTATCRGDGALHQLAWDATNGWRCSCPARGRCAHLLALGAVTAVDLAGAQR